MLKNNSFNIENICNLHCLEKCLPVAVINLSNIKSNVKEIKSKVNSKFIAVVKSDGYGHGMEMVASTVENDVDYFAVATIDEAIRLRISGITKNILCLLPCDDTKRAIFYNVTLTVEKIEDVENICRYIDKNGGYLSCFIAINSGMNRFGFNSLKDVEIAYNMLCENRVFVCGAYSHFYSDNKENCFKQFEIFNRYLHFLKGKNSNIKGHICSSNQLQISDDFHLDFVRVGLNMYGYKSVNSTFNLKKAMKIYGKILSEKHVESGFEFLYSPFKTRKESDYKIVACGYDCGFINGFENSVNRCCMNVSGLISNDKDFCLLMDDAEIVAKKNNTIVYDVITKCGKLCKRLYVKESK